VTTEEQQPEVTEQAVDPEPKIYSLKDNSFTIRQTPVEEKATGNPRGHLSAKIGDVILEFPFDCRAYDDIYTGHTFSIPLPGSVFEENFEQTGGPVDEPAVGAQAEEEGELSDYTGMTVEQLQDELRSRDLPTSGTKAELIARLEADDAETTQVM
jgi:SAP domain